MSLLAILTPASDLALLSPEELRIAAGLADDDTSQDTKLSALGLEAAEWVAGDICGIRPAGVNPPTVLAEELHETFSPAWHGCELILARRFVSDVTVTENGIALTEGTDFLVLDDRGVLQRISGGYLTPWLIGPIVVDYTAGFSNGSPSTLPPAIKAVATDYVRLRLSGSDRDPMVRSETTNDIDSVTYRDAADSQGVFEEAARNRLSRFIADTFG